jgi:dephospho-CoA kinase
MLTIALTGGIGSGKTQVSNLFASLDVPIIDTDHISRQLVEPGQPAHQQISKYFGDQVLLETGYLNRAHLRQIIFNDSTARKSLENILHPAIRHEVQEQLNNIHSSYVIIVIPLYVETGQFLKTDRVLVIDCPEATQRARVLSRDNISVDQFEQILHAQATREQRLAIADDIITNDADLEVLKKKVQQLHQKYLEAGKRFQLGKTPY